MSNLKHVMVDLETMGTMAGCVGLSIGAVEFCPFLGTLGKEFYSVVSRADSLERYLREEDGTKAWWDKQSAEARKVIEHADAEDAPTLPEVMENFNTFLLSIGGMRSLRIYGNGADFDNPILRVMWDAAGIKPFNSDAGFFGGRCYRTLKSLDELLGPRYAAPKMQRSGTHHNALDDAKSQALHLISTLHAIRGAGY